MKSLIRVLIISLAVNTVPNATFAQFGSKKYLRKNKKAESYTYGDSTLYGRGICSVKSKIFIGNSNGAMYYINTILEKQQIVFKQPGFTEMRDVEYCNGKILGMQSGDKGQLVQIDLSGGMKIIQYPEWDSLFLDAMDFRNKRGFLMADPTNGEFNLFHTADGGTSWSRCEGSVPAYKGEAGFAASGSNVQILNDSTYVFVSGGQKSRFFKSTNNGKTWETVVLPYYPGESIGGYSMCFANDSVGVIVGGDYKDPAIRLNTTFYTTDGGESWMNAMENPRGYRSCTYYSDNVFYACGRNGIDYSTNNGKDWLPFADGTFYSMTSIGDVLIATEKYGTVKMFRLVEN